MKVFVTRHGVTPMNKAKKVNGEIDEPLAVEGVEQAKEASFRLPKSVKIIYTSPLQRARHTAELINSFSNVTVTVAEELIEVRMGKLAGFSWDEMENGLELKKKHRSVAFDYTSFGGESADEVKNRLLSFFKQIAQKHSNGEVLLVTHGGIMRTIYLLERGEIVDETEKHVSFIEVDVDKILANVLQIASGKE